MRKLLGVIARLHDCSVTAGRAGVEKGQQGGLPIVFENKAAEGSKAVADRSGNEGVDGKEKFASPVSKPRRLVKEVEFELSQTGGVTPRTRLSKMASSNSKNRTLRAGSLVSSK